MLYFVLYKNKKADTWVWGLGYWTRANNEICLLATKGNPKKISSRISKSKIKILSEVIPEILTQAIDFNGTTIINFSYGNQVAGDFKQFLNVFGKQGELCPRCEHKLKKIFVSQRGTHFCPKCQKL